MLRAILLSAMVVAGLAAQEEAASSVRRFGPDSPDRGLWRDPAALAPYAADPAHPWNRVFRLLWTQWLVPSEVAATLPREGPSEFAPGWVHRKRAGAGGELRLFGGDGRQLPLEALSDEDAAELRQLLAAIDGTDVASAPALAVLFQHDLLRAAQRLLDIEHRTELVPLLWRAARAVALDGAALARLDDTLATAMAAGGGDPALRQGLPRAIGGTGDGYREVLRRSTRLFDAERTLLWSRVWIRHPDGEAALAALLPAPDAATPDVPVGFAATLVQGIVAFDRDGVPHATPIVTDVRTQVLANRDGLSAANATFTKDGIDFRILHLEREAVRSGTPARWFREVLPDDQDLFRDYGTAKHTTYRGQCSLCHRNTDTPEPTLGGFVVLRPHAKPSFASTGDERLRLAEQQAAKLAAKFAASR